MLGLSKAAISEHLSKLEASLGARLLHRTTRRMSLTEAGDSFHRSCVRIVEEAEAATAVVRDLQAEPSGVLRVTAPPDLGPRFLVPRLAELSRRYPKLNVEVLLDDHRHDLLEEQIDVAIRGVTLGVGRGKKAHDKRAAIAERTEEREALQELRARQRRGG